MLLGKDYIMSKQCFKCRQVKELCEFYKHKGMVDGYLGKCKDCTKMDVLTHRNQNLDRIRAYDRARGKLPQRIRLTVIRTRRRRKNRPLQYAAQTLLGNAVRSGRIVKSKTCTNCGADGRINGHHRDYCKPLDVMWLCTICHHKQHKLEVYHGR